MRETEPTRLCDGRRRLIGGDRNRHRERIEHVEPVAIAWRDPERSSFRYPRNPVGEFTKPLRNERVSDADFCRAWITNDGEAHLVGR